MTDKVIYRVSISYESIRHVIDEESIVDSVSIDQIDRRIDNEEKYRTYGKAWHKGTRGS